MFVRQNKVRPTPRTIRVHRRITARFLNIFTLLNNNWSLSFYHRHYQIIMRRLHHQKSNCAQRNVNTPLKRRIGVDRNIRLVPPRFRASKNQANNKMRISSTATSNGLAQTFGLDTPLVPHHNRNNKRINRQRPNANNRLWNTLRRNIQKSNMLGHHVNTNRRTINTTLDRRYRNTRARLLVLTTNTLRLPRERLPNKRRHTTRTGDIRVHRRTINLHLVNNRRRAPPPNTTGGTHRGRNFVGIHRPRRQRKRTTNNGIIARHNMNQRVNRPFFPGARNLPRLRIGTGEYSSPYQYHQRWSTQQPQQPFRERPPSLTTHPFCA